MDENEKLANRWGCSFIGSVMVCPGGHFFEIDIDTEPIRELPDTPPKWLQDRIRKGRDYLTVITPPPNAPKKKKIHREGARRRARCVRELHFPEVGGFVSPAGRKMLGTAKTPGAPIKEWEPVKRRTAEHPPKCRRRLNFDEGDKMAKMQEGEKMNK